jgi:hypothetical protein
LARGARQVWTVEFPGPSVYAKQARGLYCRFLCDAGVTTTAQLGDFVAWSAVASNHGLPCAYKLSSRDDTKKKIVFARVGSTGAAAKPSPKPAAARKAPAAKKPAAKRQRQKK